MKITYNYYKHNWKNIILEFLCLYLFYLVLFIYIKGSSKDCDLNLYIRQLNLI
jgi:hypothetical protein